MTSTFVAGRIRGTISAWTKMNWITLSFLAALFFTGVVLFTKLLTGYRISAPVLNFYFFAAAALGFLIMGIFQKQSFVIPKASLAGFAGLVLAALAYNEFVVRALATAPNAAYPQAILASNLVVIAVASVLFFGADLSVIKLLGLLLVCAGIVIVSLVK